MAIYINNRRWVSDPSKPKGIAEIIDYFVDTPADIAALPGTDRLKESSTALVVGTGDVYALTESGWVKL